MKRDYLKHLPEITRRIVSTSNPEKIILFGSYAREDFNPDSDLDLLVIKDDVDSTREEARQAAKLAGQVCAWVDGQIEA